MHDALELAVADIHVELELSCLLGGELVRGTHRVHHVEPTKQQSAKLLATRSCSNRRLSATRSIV